MIYVASHDSAISRESILNNRDEVMLIKIMTIAFSSAYGGFNDEELFDFVRDKELISVNDCSVERTQQALSLKFHSCCQVTEAAFSSKKTPTNNLPLARMLDFCLDQVEYFAERGPPVERSVEFKGQYRPAPIPPDMLMD